MLYLASNSPQRSDILRNLAVEFSVLKSSFDEKPLHLLGLPPVQLSKKIATEKLEHALKENAELLTKEDTIFAADTMIFLNNKIVYGKPNSKEEARIMLQSYSGKSHYALTTIAACNYAKPNKQFTISNSTKVWFSKLSETELEFLLSLNEWENAAGAYRIQGRSSLFIERIDGSYTGVLGFPTSDFYNLTKKLKISILS